MSGNCLNWFLFVYFIVYRYSRCLFRSVSLIHAFKSAQFYWKFQRRRVRLLEHAVLERMRQDRKRAQRFCASEIRCRILDIPALLT